jgi:O-antigen ligase
MTETALLMLILWFGLLTLRAAEAVRWWLTGFDLALLGLAAAFLLRRRMAIRFHPIAVVLAGAALWGVAQVWFRISVDPQRTLQSSLGWMVDCVAFSLTLAICGSERVRERFLTAQAWFALALSAAATIGLYTIAELGPFAYKNQFAAYLEVGTGIAVARAVRGREHSIGWMAATPWIPAAGAMFAAAAAAGSRAGAILCLAELLVLPAVAAWRGWISGRELARIAALAMVSAGVLVMVTGWETVWRRLQEPNPYAVRANLLRSSIAMARDRPLTGFGLGAWPSAYPGYARYDDGTFVNQAHNDWAQWAVEGGLPLLIAMLAVAGMLLRPAVESLWGLGLMAVFVHAWVDYPFEQRPALAAFLFAMAGALAATASTKPCRPDEPSRAGCRC